MGKSIRKSVLLAKLQTVSGTAALPVGSTDAMLVRNLSATPLSAEFVDRDLYRPFMGNSGQVATTHHSKIDFEVELAGSGTAGKEPSWGRLLRACGFAETITETVDVLYTPISENFEQVTLHYYLDGLLHKITDARGTVSLDVTAKAIPVMKFSFMGAYEPIADATLPSPIDFSAFKLPLAVNKKNTPQWSLGAYSGCLQSLTFDMANELVWRALINCEGAVITDRKPTGKLVLELPSIAQLNWPQMVLSGAGSPLSITHGTQAGYIVQISTPTAQLINPTYSEQDKIAMLNLDMNINPGDLGNDEIEIRVK